MNIDLLKSEIEASIKVKQQLLEDEILLESDLRYFQILSWFS